MTDYEPFMSSNSMSTLNRALEVSQSVTFSVTNYKYTDFYMQNAFGMMKAAYERIKSVHDSGKAGSKVVGCSVRFYEVLNDISNDKL